MSTTIYTEEAYLAHHGIKGQKWGIRRFQNEDGSLTREGLKRYGTAGPKDKTKVKDIRKERWELVEKYSNLDPRRKAVDELEKEAYSLAEKYDFDGDDGGGATTEEGRKAGQRYMELWEQHDRDLEDIERQAAQKVNKELLAKYGEKKMSQLQRGDTARAIGAGAAVVGILVTAPISLPVLVGVSIAISAKEDKKREKESAAKKE